MGVTVEITDTASAVEALQSVLDVLVEVDLDGLTCTELDEHLKVLIGQQHRLQYAASTLAARWDAELVWAADGSKSAAAHLSRATHTSRATAAGTIRLGRALRDMPATAAAMKQGELSADHARLLGSCNTPERSALFTGSAGSDGESGERLLVGSAASLTFDQFAKAAAYWKRHADEACGNDGKAPDVSRGVSAGAGVGGEVHVEGDLDPVGGAEFLTALDRIVKELAAADKKSGRRVSRSKKQLRCDALVEMARRAMAMPEGARKPRPLVSVIVGQAEFDKLCELSNGTVIGPENLLVHLEALDIETLVFDGQFVGIEKSNQRNFVGALRRVIQVRDRHCQHPSGCDEPIDRCDVDHVVPRHQGGETSQFNARLLCLFHNRIQPQYTTPPVPPEIDPRDERDLDDPTSLPHPPPGDDTDHDTPS